MRDEAAPFQLEISAKRDPLESGVDETPSAPPDSCATISLNGLFNNDACDGVFGTISRLFGAGTDSIVIEMQNVQADDASCLERFAAELMALRSAGRHVQVLARKASMHASLALLASSRDWLLSFTNSNVRGARRGIHVDRAEGGR